MSRQTVVPSPGIYYGTSFSEYRGWDAVNKSRMDKLWDETPLHYHLDVAEPSTRSTSLGDVFHALTLEPRVFAEDYTLQVQCSARTGKKADGAQCSKMSQGMVEGIQFCTTHIKKMKKDAEAGGGEIIFDPVQIVSVSEWDGSHHMRDHVMGDPLAEELIRGAIDAGTTEVSIVWWMETENGLVLCKARIDAWDIPDGRIADLKSSKVTNVPRFMKEVDKYGYHRQASMYSSGAMLLNETPEKFFWIVQENHFPWDTVVIEPGQRTMGVGAVQTFDILTQVAKRKKDKNWPGASDGETSVIADLPEYRLKQFS